MNGRDTPENPHKISVHCGACKDCDTEDLSQSSINKYRDSSLAHGARS